jgi:hypothetical protein
VVIAKEFYPIPFRTRPSKPSASMVLRLKPRESRTLPGLPRAEEMSKPANTIQKSPAGAIRRGFCFSTRRIVLFFCLAARGGAAGLFVFPASESQESRIATAPAVSNAAAAMRLPVSFSRRKITEIKAANRIEVSRSAATAATGVLVIAHTAMP